MVGDGFFEREGFSLQCAQEFLDGLRILQRGLVLCIEFVGATEIADGADPAGDNAGALRDHGLFLGNEFLDGAVSADAAAEGGHRGNVVGLLAVRLGLINDFDLVLHIRNIGVRRLEIGTGDGEFSDVADRLAAEGDLAAAEPYVAEVMQGG